MPLLPLYRRPAPPRERPATLPAPGPFPARQPPRDAVIVFVVILIVLAWLVAHGNSAGTAMETITGAGVLAAGITSRLAGQKYAGN